AAPRSCVFMPEVKRLPATPDRSLSHSRCSLALGILKFLHLAEKSARVVLTMRAANAGASMLTLCERRAGPAHPLRRASRVNRRKIEFIRKFARKRQGETILWHRPPPGIGGACVHQGGAGGLHGKRPP